MAAGAALRHTNKWHCIPSVSYIS